MNSPFTAMASLSAGNYRILVALLTSAVWACGIGASPSGHVACDEPRFLPPEPIELAGMAVYAPVGAVVARDSLLLIAGAPTFRVRHVDGAWVAHGDSSIGLIRRPDGSVDPVPYPPGVKPEEVSGVRAAASPGRDGWSVIFAQALPSSDATVPGITYWLGHLSRDLRWSDLRSHTLPQMTGLRPEDATALAVSQSEVLFALPGDDATGWPGTLMVSVRAGIWSTEHRSQNYSSFGFSPWEDRHPIAVFTHPDPTKQSDSGSLFLYERAGERWTLVRRLHEGGHGASASHPQLSTEDSLIVAFVVGTPPRLRADLLSWAGPPAPVRQIVLDSLAVSATTMTWGQEVMALVQHREFGPVRGELRLVAVSSAPSPKRVVAMPDPFYFPPHPAPVTPTEVVVVGVGGERESPDTPPLFVSVVRIVRACLVEYDARSPARRVSLPGS
jgi:hypothetical protein